ncbi:MAG: 3-hydroxyacyl-CoA dehydrogenase, partial [Deltaproteobacteria bacterium]
IAYVSAYAGMAVVLKDLSREAAQKGKERIARIVEGRVSRGKLDRAAAEALLDRIHPTADAGDLAGCDLVIEAVFENREVKAKVTRETEAVMDPNGVFASNTSTLPITSLARASVRPERFIGLHFFSPVHKMKLVEIIVGAKTSDETIAKAFDYVQKIRKIPIVVNDNRGFFTSRVFGTYVEEGMTMLGEGYHPQGVESAGLQAGFPVGPLAVSDEVSLGLMDHIRRQTIEDFAAEGREYRRRCHEDVLDRMIELGRLGRAHGGGFYDYPEGGKRLWPGLLEHFPRRKDVDLPEMIDRILFVQAVETVRAMEENVLRSVADANIGSIFGWGFPPFHGGVLQFIDAYGTRAFVARARELAHRYGPRFEPPSRLLAMAERDERFFAGPAPKR